MLAANNKLPLLIKNRTTHFSPDSDRVSFDVASPRSYSNRVSKIEGYETRLYWQYEYCKLVGGCTFFYTLTYNDNNIPNHYDMNCFDYEDLRDLLTGGFRKQLLRKYGCTFKYFIGAELGDGKGKRGMCNNPHYHILFFIEPAGSKRYPFSLIKPEEFRHLVKMYWQGFDEYEDRENGVFHDYRTACIYGIAREGEHAGLVSDYRACMYCAKYVCKDTKLVRNEKHIEGILRLNLFDELARSEDTYSRFWKEVLRPKYNVPSDAKHTKWHLSDSQMYWKITTGSFPEWLFCDEEWSEFSLYRRYTLEVIEKNRLWNEFHDFCETIVADKVRLALNEWRNRYSNKCRVSNGVGLYGLSQINDKLEPLIKVPYKDGFKNRPIGQYYYRKLFTDVCIDSNGSPLYILNEDGIQYKLHKLQKQLPKVAETASLQLNLILGDSELYSRILSSDVNLDVRMPYEVLTREIQSISNSIGLNEFFTRYAQYKLVYKDRFFRFPYHGNSKPAVFPRIDVLGDYRKFLIPSVYSIPRNDLRLDMFLEDTDKDYLAYFAHPYFLRYISIFDVLDLISDYFFIQKDDEKQRVAEDIQRLKRFHDKQKLNEYYANFKQ